MREVDARRTGFARPPERRSVACSGKLFRREASCLRPDADLSGPLVLRSAPGLFGAQMPLTSP